MNGLCVLGWGLSFSREIGFGPLLVCYVCVAAFVLSFSGVLFRSFCDRHLFASCVIQIGEFKSVGAISIGCVGFRRVKLSMEYRKGIARSVLRETAGVGAVCLCGLSDE